MFRARVILLLSVFTSAVYALPAEIYRIEAPVADQSEAVRTTVARSTLGDVIVKVAGDTQVLENPVVRDAINNPSSYVQKFSYLADKDKTEGSLKLVLNYSPQAIDKLLNQTQLPLGTGTGPQTIVFEISDIQDFSSFKQVQAYLKTVSIIHRAELISVNKDVAQFNVSVDGDAASIANFLASGNKLQSLNNSDANVRVLSFRWIH